MNPYQSPDAKSGYTVPVWARSSGLWLCFLLDASTLLAAMTALWALAAA